MRHYQSGADSCVCGDLWPCRYEERNRKARERRKKPPVERYVWIVFFLADDSDLGEHPILATCRKWESAAGAMREYLQDGDEWGDASDAVRLVDEWDGTMTHAYGERYEKVVGDLFLVVRVPLR